MNPRRILVRSVNWLGDAVMSTPALLRLREKFPDAKIVLLTPEKLAELWHHHPAVDEVLMFSSRESLWKIGRQLRAQKFDLGIVFPNSPRSALELWLGGVPVRIGYAARWRRWLLTQRVQPRAEFVALRKRSPAEIRQIIGTPAVQNPNPKAPNYSAHHIHQYLNVVAAIGAKGEPLAPQLRVTDAEVAAFQKKFGLDAKQAPKFWLGLNGGAEYGPAKRWSAERFAKTTIEVHKKLGCGWIIFGGKGDWHLAAELTQKIGVSVPQTALLSVAGRTSLRELLAGLKSCRAVLTNDTGPMHVAAALGVPVVVPFGSTSPELTGPGLPGDARHTLIRGEAPCAPCFLRECPIDSRCMTSIGINRVVDAVVAAVTRGNSRSPAPVRL